MALTAAGAGMSAVAERGTETGRRPAYGAPAQPTSAEAAYLRPGLHQPGRKLPLFDAKGRPVRPQVIHACLARGWAERWFANPLAPGWLVCRLTDEGARALRR
jgi:hypothetical protein